MELKNLDSHLFSKYPTRFKRDEKDSFLLFMAGIFKQIGYEEKNIKIRNMKETVENNNLVVGKPNPEYLFTAHYDTAGKTGYFFSGSKIFGRALAQVIICSLLFLFSFACVYLLNMFLFRLFDDLSFAVRYLITIGWILLFLIIFMVIPMIQKNKYNRNDNTSGVLAVLKIAELISANNELKDKCGFILFDNEEWGLLGSIAYKKWCRRNKIDLSRTKVINLDSVGNGDVLTFISTSSKNETLQEFKKKFEQQEIEVATKTSSVFFTSDHTSFKNSFMISRLSMSNLGFAYIPNIHTAKDTQCDIEKIEELSLTLYNAICK